MKLAKRILAMALVFCLLLTGVDTVAIAEALALQALELPQALKIIEEEAFFGDPAMEKAVLPEGIVEIHARAFAQSGLKEINLPSSLTYIAEDAFDGCGALTVTVAEDCYAYDWALSHGLISQALEAEPLLCSLNGDAQVGDEVMWVARASGGSGAIEYSFEVYCGDVLVTAQDFSQRNYISVVVDSLGAWRAVVTCRDEMGSTTPEMSHTVEVLEPPVCIENVAGNSGVVVAGEQLTWTVTAADGTSPVTYAYELLINGERFATQGYSTNHTYTCTAYDAGSYVLIVTCKDGAGRTAVMQSDAITVYSGEEAIPAAPVLVFAAGEAPFAASEADAPAYAPQRFALGWEAQEHAQSYALTLEKKSGDAWEAVLQEERIEGVKYELDAALFRSLTAEAVYRLSITANGLRVGGTAAYYFRVVPVIVDETITVNGKTAITWEQSSKYASVRTFTVASELEWTVDNGGAEWISCAVSGNTLTVSLAESGIVDNRTKTITLSNGVNTATIKVTQGVVAAAPVLVQPMVFSQDPDNPTEYPVSQFNLRWSGDNNRTRVRVYDVTDGVWMQLSQISTVAQYRRLTESALGTVFQSGRTYAIELAAVHSGSFASYEVEEHLLKNTYYVHMVDEGHQITVNGESAISLGGAMEETTVYVAASGFFNCTTDAEWLTLDETLVEDNGVYVTITAAHNATGQARTGHAIFTCGTATATVTVVQEDMSLKVLHPTGLSQTESSPTTLYMDLNLLDTNYYYLAYQGEDMYMEVYADGAYGEPIRIGSQSAFGKSYAQVCSDDVSGSTKCRLTIEYGDQSAVYYVRFRDDDCQYRSVVVSNDLYTQREVSAGKNTLSIPVDAETAWKVTSDASWLTTSAQKGSAGAANLTVTAAANTTGAVRTGILTFESTVDDSVAWYEVTQAAGDHLVVYFYNDAIEAYEPYDPARHCTEIFEGSTETTEKFRAYAPGYCRVESNDDWLSSSVLSPDPGESFVLEMEENNTGAVRTGSVTVKYGECTQTITVTQAPALGDISLTSPALSTSSSEPTIVTYGDLTLKWPAIANAVRYEIDTTINSGDRMVIRSTGASSYSCVLPASWFDPYRTSYQRIYFYAYDQFGYEVSGSFYLIVTSGEMVQLGGETAPEWINAPDTSVSEEYVVQSTAEWTAAADQSWITLSAAAGASGDTLTVTLAENTAAAVRTGHVTVKSGSASAVLTISQCAYLAEEYPTMLSPLFSADKANPVVLAPTDTLTFTWLSEPQAESYELTIYRQTSENVRSTVAKSPTFTDGQDSYTFTGLALEAGELYSVKLSRKTDRWHATSRSFYFTLADENAWIQIDGASTAAMEAEADGDSEAFDITASGYWVARTSDDWLMVYKSALSEDDLAAEGETAADHDQYSNVSGTALYVSALPNTGSEPRTGVVTISCGGAAAKITVTQYQGHTLAELTSHALGTRPSASVEVPFGTMNLRWSAGEGGTGRYEIALYESENRIAYGEILSSDSVSGTRYTISSGEFTEGMYYRLWLGTEIASGEYFGQNYYFRMQYRDQLAASVKLSQTTATVGVHLGVSASASGGAGGYAYAFQLLDGDAVVEESTYGSRSTYSFAAPAEGEYQVRVYVRDSAGNVATALSGSFAALAPQDTLSLSRTYWAADAAGESITMLVDASSEWQMNTSAAWLTLEAVDGGTRITAAANTDTASREAAVSFTCGTASATLRVVQNGAPAQTDTLSLSRTSWNTASADADGVTVWVTASGAWSVTSQPDWITVTPNAAAGSVALYANANAGASRYGEVVFTCGSVSQSLMVSQAGGDIPAMVTSITLAGEEYSVGEALIFTVETSGANRVVLMVDGVCYPDDTAYVYNDKAILNRTFTAAGERKVQFVPWYGDVQGTVSDAITVNVTSQGTLAAPMIDPVADCYVGESCVINWNDVPNAQQYVLYLRHNGSLVMPKITVKDSQWELPESVLATKGAYTLQVVATGVDWAQSDAVVIFSVEERVKNFTLLAPQNNNAYVCADENYWLKASNPDGSNLAFRVTYDGQTYYYPETGTLNTAAIELQAPILGAGTYTATLEAYANADRTGTPWAASQAVTFKVNGPLKVNAYVGRNTSDRSLFTKDATFISVTTNNATDHIDVMLDGQLLFTMGEADRTVDGYQYTFRRDMTPPTEGYHVFTLHAEDAEGNAADWTLPYYMITSVEHYTVYPNGAAGIDMTYYPVAGSTVLQAEMNPSEPMTVEGVYGDYLYGEYNGSYGYVKKEHLSAARTSRWDALSVSFKSAGGEVPNVMQGDPKFTIRVSWDCSVRLPENAVFRLYLRDAEIGAKTLIYEGVDTEHVLSTENLRQYRHWAILEVQSKDGGVTYASIESANAVCDVWSAEEYLNYVNADFGDILERLDGSVQWLMMVHDLFDRGLFDANGLVEETPINPSDVAGNVLYKAYAIIIDGNVDQAVGVKYTRAAWLAEQILADITNDSGKNIETSWTVINFFLDQLKLPSDILFPLTDILKEYCDEDGMFSITQSKWSKAWEESGTGKYVEHLSILGDFLFDMVRLYIEYTSIPASKQDELQALIDCFDASGDDTLQVTADYLRMIRNGGLTLATYLVIAYAPEILQEYLVPGVTNLLIEAISKGSLWAAAVTTGINGGKWVNNTLGNINDIQSAAFQWEWAVDGAKAYRAQFETDYAAFQKNPLKEYASFVESLSTFATLVKKEYDAYDGFLKEMDLTVGGDIVRFFMDKAEYEVVSPTLKNFVDTPIEVLKIQLNYLYNDYLSYYGLDKAEWFGP